MTTVTWQYLQPWHCGRSHADSWLYRKPDVCVEKRNRDWVDVTNLETRLHRQPLSGYFSYIYRLRSSFYYPSRSLAVLGEGCRGVLNWKVQGAFFGWGDSPSRRWRRRNG